MLITPKKPSTTKDLVVVDVIFAAPSCTDKWGWEVFIDNHYSPHLKPGLRRKEFEAFVKEANHALLASKLRSGGLLVNTLVILSCCLPGVCIKYSVDSASKRALCGLEDVIQKWNQRLARKNRPTTMRLQYYTRKLDHREIRADGTLDATLSNAKRLAECDHEAWIEIEIAAD